MDIFGDRKVNRDQNNSGRSSDGISQKSAEYSLLLLALIPSNIPQGVIGMELSPERGRSGIWPLYSLRQLFPSLLSVIIVPNAMGRTNCHMLVSVMRKEVRPFCKGATCGSLFPSIRLYSRKRRSQAEKYSRSSPHLSNWYHLSSVTVNKFHAPALYQRQNWNISSSASDIYIYNLPSQMA